jgi:hypothetical protein
MISPRCDLQQFLDAVQTMEYLEVIGLADKEATDAERLRFRMKREKIRKPGECHAYPERIKGFIHYLRYGVKNSLVRPDDVPLFSALREGLLVREPPEEEE